MDGEEKLPKEEDEGMVGEGIGDVKRVCDLCGKEFGSGKALGGHMRIHVQRGDLSQKQVVRFKRKSQKKMALAGFVTAAHDDGGDDVIKKKQQVCTVCLKQFPSMKALYGHMRCHPNRGWRGINPPIIKVSPPPCSSSFSSITSSSSSASISGAELQQVDDPMGLAAAAAKGWAVRGRRGRKAVAHDADEMIAASNLMLLLSAGGRGLSVESGVTQMHKFDESDAVNSFFNQDEIRGLGQVSGEKQPAVIDQASVGKMMRNCIQHVENRGKGSESNDFGKSTVVGNSPPVGVDSVNKSENQDDEGGHIHSCSYQHVSDDFVNGEMLNVMMNKIRSKKKGKKQVKLSELKSSCMINMSVPTHQASVSAHTTTSIGDQNGQLSYPTEESEKRLMPQRVLEFDLNKIPRLDAAKGRIRLPSASSTW